MLINELPDDCLLAIFYRIQDLTDLVNCFKVCEKWSNLIVVRTKKVKYFMDQPNSPDSVYHLSDEPVDVTFLSKWFPNLRIFDASYPFSDKVPKEDIAKLIRDSESLKGIMCSVYSDFELNTNIEMLSTEFIDPKQIKINETVKQLYLWNSSLGEFKKVAHYFPNLERVKIELRNLLDYVAYGSDGSVLENLKIVESAEYAGECCSFIFMDLCPALQSAHIKIACWHINVNDSIKLASLQDLVIQFYEPKGWYALPRCMSKYPNLKHLAIRNAYLSDEDIKKLVLILPKLTLLDIRESHGVTQEAADHVKVYCKQHGRSIKFYFKKDDKQIESDWPQILNQPEKICRGFDFMEHCFFKSFDNLPDLLDPAGD
uniref:F-box domain-containing protein n=1 Tax=Tetranychus urticae TaxID=32264 RepID=T1K4D6_TETUR